MAAIEPAFFTTHLQRLHLSLKSRKQAAINMALVTLHQSEGADGQVSSGVFSFGPLELHPREGLAAAGGVALHLSVREFGLLVELARNDGRIVRREELYESVWGEALRPGDRTVDVYVRRLRVKLSKALPDWSFIHTHVGFGYRFAPSLEPSPEDDALDTAL